MATMRQIARESKLSVATVCRAFHEPEKLTPETLERVAAAKKKLEVDAAAGSNLVGLHVSRVSNPFFYEVMRSMDMQLRNENYTMLSIFSGNVQTTRKDIERLCACGIKALILMPAPRTSDVTSEWLESLGIPVIQVFNELFPQFDSVCVNDEHGAYLAARYLLMAGHRRILYIGVKTKHWRGYVKAHEEMGLPIEEESALFTGVLRDQVNMIEAKILRLGATAVLAHTEYVALETIQACKQLRLRIPEDISLIAYDDYPWMSVQGISAVSHPMTGLANSVCQLVLQRAKKGKSSSPIHLLVEPRLTMRESIWVNHNDYDGENHT